MRPTLRGVSLFPGKAVGLSRSYRFDASFLTGLSNSGWTASDTNSPTPTEHTSGGRHPR